MWAGAPSAGSGERGGPRPAGVGAERWVSSRFPRSERGGGGPACLLPASRATQGPQTLSPVLASRCPHFDPVSADRMTVMGLEMRGVWVRRGAGSWP